MVILVAGASGGFGRVLAAHLADQGMKVYGTCRNPETGSTDERIMMLPMEISDGASIEACVAEIVNREGRVDAVVNCINEMFIGTVEEQSVEEVQHLYDTNVFGTLRLWKYVLPVMRRQGRGTIVTMSSLGGLLAVPTMSAYTSAKFALEALSEALYHEVRGQGIDVVIMQPVAMAIDRPATGAHLQAVKGAQPGSRTFKMVTRMERDTAASNLTPEAVARRVHKVLVSSRKPLRVPMNRARPLGIIKRLAPQSVIDRLLDGLLQGVPPYQPSKTD